MATTTTNFGWDIPQSTDLVKDGATAIAALGQDIDTALIDLKGGTTGQVLAKASGTDLDFSWVAQDDSNAIQNALVDAMGVLFPATAADTPARLAVGTNGQVLTADSAEATGLKWASAGGGGKVLQVVYGMYNTDTSINNTSYTATGLTATITPTSATSKILVFASNFFYIDAASSTPSTGGRIMRGATSVYEQHPSQGSWALIIGASGSRGGLMSVNMQYLDSPATTSATTYTTQFKTNAAFVFQWDNGKSNIVLMEIGA
jgi:hypothetical protein